MKSVKQTGVLLAVTAAALFATASMTTASAAQGDHTVRCYGVNACKGLGQCNGRNSCGASNSCKGKGWIAMTKQECDQKGGHEQD